MQIDSLDREVLQDVVFQLEQALYNHQQWYNSIIRSLVCRLPADQHDMCVDAHKECRFGQWYYGAASEKLRKHPGFSALGKEHINMHQKAAKLLSLVEGDMAIHAFDYDNFANALEKVRLEIGALQRELNELLYNHDALTGTINRVNMLPILREQQSLVKRKAQPCSIAMMDVDDFKKINDQYGHAAGDCVLVWLTRFIIERQRPYDKIFRVGGEEFLLCLDDTDIKLASNIIERLRKEIATNKVNINKNKAINITVSFGVAAVEPDIPIEESIEHADQALYKAKANGRNCTLTWD